MASKLNIFLNKKILIYGLGKSGYSAFKFLKNKNDVSLFDDFNPKIRDDYTKNKIISYKNILTTKFDLIILSPGIDVNKCKLSKFLKKNIKKIYSDLDVFYSFFKNDCITITGTNGKSTTCQLLYEIFLQQKFDVKLVGNIGNPILSVKKVKKKTIFIIEASSYQLEYSKIFKSKYALILNLSPDHIERHKTMNNYVKAKFKLLKNQLKGHYAFVKKNDLFIKKELKLSKFESKIIRVDTKKNNILKNIHNNYFLTETNKENLLFALEISKKFNLKNNLLLKTIQNFKGLKYRQQIIFRKNNLTIINDSKSTSFSSSIGVLKVNPNIYWLLGGIYKKGDKFNLPKKYFNNISAFIYGKNKKFFNQKLKGKIKYENFNNVKDGLKKIFMMIKNKKSSNQTILFSPSAASFDSFKNFEDRGYYFNKLVKKYLNVL
jgi:UDP-N-acetylmuramoylalanine--D-glutamate ligase